MSGKMKIKVVSDEEASKADFAVCLLADLPTPFTDNERGTCHDCGRAVQFRPYMPKGPRKICVECMVTRSEAERQGGINQ